MTALQQVNPRVRGIRASSFRSLQTLAANLASQISQGVQKPFEVVIDVSSGDPHKAGINPISFVRQVLSVCLYPELLHNENLPIDVRWRAQRFLEACDGGSVGSYTASSGLPHVQESIAAFLTRRDGGVPSYPHNIFIAAGSQMALMVVVKLLVSGQGENQTGVLTPLPCPHTIPMVLDEAGARMVPYHLREDDGWSVHLEELQSALEAARGCCRPRVLYISNPGNPTGHLQDRNSIAHVINFAAAEGLFLLVDEVYQDSIYGQGREFVSYKKVLYDMGQKYLETVEMASFHSLSNGIMGECGLRAGYMEVINMDPDVMLFAETMLCTDISTPVTGQLALELMVRPPRHGEASFHTYSQVSGIEADVLYCQMLLEEEGVCVGAGCENGHAEGNYHLRLCVLVPPATLEEYLPRLRSFHLRLLDRFGQLHV